MKTKRTFIGWGVALCAIMLIVSSTANAGPNAPRLNRIARLHNPTVEGHGSTGANRSAGVMSGSLFRPSQGMAREDQFKGLFDKAGNR